eukprot:jgi/Ulvmu1/2267/UM013_0114.1
MASLIRRLVSRHKIRFQNEEFDLDLTYITDRIIAMSWPGDGAEGWYRNPIGEVARMLDKYHGGHYRVYNLCSERGYNESIFTGGSVITFPMDDHQVPPLPMLFDFSRDAQDYLAQDEANTVVIHCKAGKGRTGICIAALLLTLGRSHTWSAALAQFAISRTANGVGVTIASQRRWVQYFDTARTLGAPPSGAPLDLTAIRITGLPARLAPRLVIVLSQREYSEEKGYHPRVLVAAGLSRGYSSIDAGNGAGAGDRAPGDVKVECGCAAGAGGSSFGQLLCGAPNKGPGNGSMKLPGVGPLAITGGAEAKAPLRVQSGRGWRMVLADETTLSIEFEDEHGHCEACSRVEGDFRVHVFLDSVSRSRSLFWAWHNTAFMSGNACTLARDGLDKVSSMVPAAVELTLRWRPAGESLPSALAAARGTSESALLTPGQQDCVSDCLGGDSGLGDPDCTALASADDPLGVTCAHLPEVPPRRLTPDNTNVRAFYVDPQHLPRQPPAMAGAIDSPRDADRDHRDTEAIDLSLLKLFDGQWMGACDGEPRRQSVPAAPAADAMVRVNRHPSWATTHLHRTSAFLKVTEARLNGNCGSGHMRSSVRAPCTSEPLPRRSASASAGHTTGLTDRSAFATCGAAGGSHSHFTLYEAHPGLPGICIGASHSHVEPDDGGVYTSSGHPPISPLAGALSNPLSVSSGVFARTISQPSFPHATAGTSAPVGTVSPLPAAGEASASGLSSRSQAAHRGGASSFLEYCHTSHTSIADELSDEEDSNCALLPHLTGEGRGLPCQYSHASHVPQGKIPLRLPPPPPRRQPRYKVGSALAPRGGAGRRSLPPWRAVGDMRRDDGDVGYDSAASEGRGMPTTPPLPRVRSRRLQRTASGHMRTSSSHSGLRGGGSGALLAAHASRRTQGMWRTSEQSRRLATLAPRCSGAASDSGCLGMSAPTALHCEDPLAPWAGDPASIVAGPSAMSLEEYVASASAFDTSDGTGFSGDLRDSISFGTVR